MIDKCNITYEKVICLPIKQCPINLNAIKTKCPKLFWSNFIKRNKLTSQIFNTYNLISVPKDKYIGTRVSD